MRTCWLNTTLNMQFLFLNQVITAQLPRWFSQSDPEAKPSEIVRDDSHFFAEFALKYPYSHGDARYECTGHGSE